MKMRTENDFRESISIMLDAAGYPWNDGDDDHKPSPPVTKLLMDKEREEKEPPAIVDDHQKVMKKSSSSSEEERPAVPVNHHYKRRTTEFKEEPVGKLMLPAEKRPFLKLSSPVTELLMDKEREEKEPPAIVDDHQKVMKKSSSSEEEDDHKRPVMPVANHHYQTRTTEIEESAPAKKRQFFKSYQEEEEATRNKKKKKKKKTNNKRIRTRDSPPNQPPPLPHKYREKVNAMGGSEPVLVIQKRLSKSDMKQQLNRLSMPIRQIEAKFLTESLTDDEKGHLKKKELEVTLIDPRLVEWTLNMREWNMNSIVYVLRTNWYKLVVENEFQNDDLKEKTEVQLWSFRVGTRLCFVLVRLNI